MLSPAGASGFSPHSCGHWAPGDTFPAPGLWCRAVGRFLGGGASGRGWWPVAVARDGGQGWWPWQWPGAVARAEDVLPLRPAL